MLNNFHVVLLNPARPIQKCQNSHISLKKNTRTQFSSNIVCKIIIVLLLKALVEHLPITNNLTIMLKQLRTGSNALNFFLCMHTSMG